MTNNLNGLCVRRDGKTAGVGDGNSELNPGIPFKKNP